MALAVGTSDHHHLIFCIFQFDLVDPKSDTCSAIFHGVDLKVTHGFDFSTHSFIKLSISCESMAVNGKLVDTSEWDKLHQEKKIANNRSLGHFYGQWYICTYKDTLFLILRFIRVLCLSV